MISIVLGALVPPSVTLSSCVSSSGIVEASSGAGVALSTWLKDVCNDCFARTVRWFCAASAWKSFRISSLRWRNIPRGSWLASSWLSIDMRLFSARNDDELKSWRPDTDRLTVVGAMRLRCVPDLFPLPPPSGSSPRDALELFGVMFSCGKSLSWNNGPFCTLGEFRPPGSLLVVLALPANGKRRFLWGRVLVCAVIKSPKQAKLVLLRRPVPSLNPLASWRCDP